MNKFKALFVLPVVAIGLLLVYCSSTSKGDLTKDFLIKNQFEYSEGMRVVNVIFYDDDSYAMSGGSTSYTWDELGYYEVQNNKVVLTSKECYSSQSEDLRVKDDCKVTERICTLSDSTIEGKKTKILVCKTKAYSTLFFTITAGGTGEGTAFSEENKKVSEKGKPTILEGTWLEKGTDNKVIVENETWNYVSEYGKDVRSLSINDSILSLYNDFSGSSNYSFQLKGNTLTLKELIEEDNEKKTIIYVKQN